jgi:hypothetical protein
MVDFVFLVRVTVRVVPRKTSMALVNLSLSAMSMDRIWSTGIVVIVTWLLTTASCLRFQVTHNRRTRAHAWPRPAATVSEGEATVRGIIASNSTVRRATIPLRAFRLALALGGSGVVP